MTPPSPFQKSALYRQPLETAPYRHTHFFFFFLLPCNGNQNLWDLKHRQCGTGKLLPKALPPALFRNSPAWTLVVSALGLFISHYPMKILSLHKKPEALQPSNSQFVAQLISTEAAVTAEHHAYVVVLETRF